jgi:hypothetical protein
LISGRFNNLDFPWTNVLTDLASSDDFADTKSASYWAYYIETKELIEARKARAAEAVGAIVNLWPGNPSAVRKVEASPAVPSPAAQDAAVREVKPKTEFPMVAVDVKDLPEKKVKTEERPAAVPEVSLFCYFP